MFKLLQIYCCLGALAIVDSLHLVDGDNLGWWLCERQLPSGGLNGTCHMFAVSHKIQLLYFCKSEGAGYVGGLLIFNEPTRRWHFISRTTYSTPYKKSNSNFRHTSTLIVGFQNNIILCYVQGS